MKRVLNPPTEDDMYKEVLTSEIMKLANAVTESERAHCREMRGLKRTAKTVVATLSCACIILGLATFGGFPERVSGTYTPGDGYLIQNLRGDSVNTWVSWNLTPGQTIHVNIVNEAHVGQGKVDAVRNAILSSEKVDLANSLFKPDSLGSSTYYLGWEGALESTSGMHPKYYIPTSIEVTELPQDVGDVAVYLIPEKSPDGLSGYTKNIADGSQILRSKITIFQANLLSAGELGAITRHEFGHALGLAHSDAPYDLMHATIETQYPYISSCDIQALSALYAGDESSKVICN